jgi:hypothetical protein
MSKKSDHDTASAGTFRPSSYWEDNNPLAAILRNVKSTKRRQMITDYWNSGCIENLCPENLADDPGPDAQRALERIHPSFMGGAYLPDFRPTEVEIARIELESTTADVISLRARRDPGSKLIHYRIVDEYETDFNFSPTTSTGPLSHDELVALVDGVNDGRNGGLALCYNEMNFSVMGEAESLRHFTTVSSQFYPGLYGHYEVVFDQWVTKNTKPCENTEPCDEEEQKWEEEEDEDKTK